jgi:hypothetical protein
MAMALVTFVASLGLLIWFDRGVAGEQFTVDLPGFPRPKFTSTSASTASASGWSCSPPS